MSTDLVLTSDVLAAKGQTHPVLAFLASLPSQSSRNTALRILKNVAGMWAHDWRTMPWASLDKPEIDLLKTSELARVSSRTGKRLSAAMVNQTLWAVKGVIASCFDLQLIDGDHLLRVQRVRGVKKDRSGQEADRPGRYISRGERERLIAACDDGTPAGYRDEAILFLLCSCGLRRGEIPGLRFESILGDEDGVLTIDVRGKGRKWRHTWANDGCRTAVFNWLDIRGRAPGPLFWRGRRGGHLERGQPIGEHSIYGLLKKRAALAGVTNIATHDLRRSFCSDLLGLGVDINTVAAMMGHASVVTTSGYDRRGTGARIAAAKTLQFAGRPRRQQP